MSTLDSAASSSRNKFLNTGLLVLGAAVLAAGIILLVIKLSSNGSSTTSQQSQQQVAPPTQGANPPVPKATQDVHVKYASLPAQLRATVKKFVLTAVVRKNVAASWDITTPGLRQGMTKKQWATGNIPPQPYPVYKFDQASFHVHAKTPNEVGIWIGLSAPPKAHLRAVTFDIGLHKFGSGPNVHWKVDYWMPHYTPPMEDANPGPGGA